MKTFLKLFYLTLFCTLISSFAYAATLTALVNRHDIAIGQTFDLIINAQSSETNLNNPDVSPLHKDFTVLGSARNQSLNIINNKVSRKDQWIIILIPKRSGKLTIPSLSIGKDKTKPLTIKVVTTEKVKSNGKQSVFIDTKLTPQSPYLNSEMIYQLRVYYNVPISAAAIVPPQSKNAVIKQLGKDQGYKTKIKGKDYQVFQRSFAIFPQKAGEIKLSPVIFRGQVASKSSNLAYAGFYALSTKPLQLIAPAITINVKPIPKSFNDKWWLPSSKVNLTEDWSIKQSQIKIGSPITRTVTLTATGLMSSQLPPLTTHSTEAYNSYGGQPTLENKLINGHLVASKLEKFVYIPTHKGSITFPAINIKWWNTKTHRLETASIPEKIFTVIPGSASRSIENASPPNAMAASKPSHSPQPKRPVNDWIYIAIGLFTLWLCTIFVWWFTKRKKKAALKKNNTKKSELKPINAMSLKQACLSDDPHATKLALLTWAKEKFKSISIQNLGDVLQQVDDQALIEQIELLQQKLYREFDSSWSGNQLWQSIKKFKVAKTKISNNKEQLPKLNPE